MTAESDRFYMRLALELAEKGQGRTSPNPAVGCVVAREGRVVGRGFHPAAGAPHAEVYALREAGDEAIGADLYVTLEPCAHHGRTPPCVDAILSAGIRRVVAAMREPNPHAGGGLDRLRAEGVDAGIGGDSDRARALNRRWLTWVQERRPWVTLKAAVSLDGRIATRTGQSKWITGEPARRRSLELREEHDAIVVGVGTVLADDPLLTRRLGLNPGESWTRVVLDSRLRTPTAAQVVQTNPEQTLIAHTPEAAPAERRRLVDAGVQLLETAAGADGRVELHQLVEQLARREVAALLVEGGAAVHGSFADAGLVDETVFLIAPLLIGGGGPSAIAGRGVADLELATRLRFEGVERHGEDIELRAVRPEDEDVHGSD